MVVQAEELSGLNGSDLGHFEEDHGVEHIKVETLLGQLCASLLGHIA